MDVSLLGLKVEAFKHDCPNTASLLSLTWVTNVSHLVSIQNLSNLACIRQKHATNPFCVTLLETPLGRPPDVSWEEQQVNDSH